MSKAYEIISKGIWILAISFCFNLSTQAKEYLGKNEGNINFLEVSENLVTSSHFDIVVYPGTASNKKVWKSIPEKVQQYGSLSAYPNPTVGNTNLDYQFAQNPEEITIQVLSADGRLVMQHKVKTNQTFGSLPLALNNLGTGFYIVTLSSKTGEVVQTKLVKQ